ncbi:alcohol dehydrogenase catalytic domain-containing protein [Chitinophaga filiformis]|uniref:alcohol dehydrogenase catalytic domain-containing protein n=1 Tax=Chitinophaga filiformis TaxID=104663 RepID=UPI001F3C7840|nr:alcohol dehydrogenase catalytic domain-containing protein [Chitinophaga filiformis]MCF6406230.1 alcohol dehydrogenase catalytic domain-containing protein [Chitinophaga filiformis]
MEQLNDNKISGVIKIYSQGDPEVLVYEEELVGDPAANQILLTHKAIGVNFVDTMFRNGTFPITKFPMGAGVEASGIIESVGKDITHFIMQIAYAIPEESCPHSCFSAEEVECLEHQIEQLEGKTDKLKNPYTSSDLKRYIWAIARLGGWKRYQSERKPGITTFWIGLQKFTAISDQVKHFQLADQSSKKVRTTTTHWYQLLHSSSF